MFVNTWSGKGIRHLHPRLSLARFWPLLMSVLVTLFRARRSRARHVHAPDHDMRDLMVKLALPVYLTCIELNLVERMQVTPSPSPPTPAFFERPTVFSWSSRRTLSEHFFWWLSPPPDSSRNHFSVVRQVHSPPPRSHLRPLLRTVPLPFLSATLSSSFALDEMAV